MNYDVGKVNWNTVLLILGKYRILIYKRLTTLIFFAYFTNTNIGVVNDRKNVLWLITK